MISLSPSKKEAEENEGGMTHTKKKEDGRTLMCAWAIPAPHPEVLLPGAGITLY